MPRLPAPAPLLVAAAIFAGACSSDSTAPNLSNLNPRITADVAQLSADAAAEDVEAMRVLNLDLRSGFGFFPSSADRAPAGRDCPFDAATGFHVCPERTVGGLTINRSYAFFDAAGAAMETFDANQTASLNLKHWLTGSIERTSDEGIRWTASVDRHRDLTVSGLQGDEQRRTWNGTGSDHTSRARFPAGADAADRSYDITSTVTVADVVVPHPNNDTRDPWPLSGTITKVITGTVTFTRDGTTETREINRTVVITFNGTQFASMTVNGEEFTVDLAKRFARRGK